MRNGLRFGLARRWALWRQGPRVMAYCLASEVVALALALRTAPPPVDRRTLLVLAALLVLGMAQAEIGRRVEHNQRRRPGPPHITMTSAWTFAGVLLLPPALLAVLVGGLHLHLATRGWYRLPRVPASRTISNAAVLLLSCYAAQAALRLPASKTSGRRWHTAGRARSRWWRPG